MLTTALLLAALQASEPPRAAQPQPPRIRYTGRAERDGETYLTFEVVNPNPTPLPYFGYTPGSFTDGLKAGTIAPLYLTAKRRGKVWEESGGGW